jgi:hypothetical protein
VLFRSMSTLDMWHAYLRLVQPAILYNLSDLFDGTGRLNMFTGKHA